MTTLSRQAQVISLVSQWPGVTHQPHRFGGTEFNLGKVEIGHIHGSHMLDVPYPKRLRDVLVNEGHAEPHHLLPDTGWVSFYLRQNDDVTQAVWLLRVSYLFKRSRRDTSFRATLPTEVAALHTSPALRQALLGEAADDSPTTD